jgi:hypothetical protein
VERPAWHATMDAAAALLRQRRRTLPAGTYDPVRHGPFSPAPRGRPGGTLVAVTSLLLLTVGVALVVAGPVMTARALTGRREIERELADQRIVFPPADRLPAELARHARAQVRTGGQARAFATLIATNLASATDGRTYAEISEELHASNGDDQLARLRETAFLGQSLRASLLGAYQAWQITVLALCLGALLTAIGLVFLVLAAT